MSISMILVGITCVISYLAFQNQDLKNKLLMHPQSVDEFGQFYRFISSGFVHADWTHLGINMYVLYIFGGMVENGILYDSDGSIVSFTHIFGDVMGKVNFLILYFGSIIAGSIPSFIKHRKNGWYRALGASGGTSGVIFAIIIFNPWEWLMFPPVPFIVFGIGYIVYSSYMSKHGKDNIGHDAHLWGGIFGLVYTLLAVYLKDPEVLGRAFERLINVPFLS